MAKTFRFSDEEEKALNDVALKLNRDFGESRKKTIKRYRNISWNN